MADVTSTKRPVAALALFVIAAALYVLLFAVLNRGVGLTPIFSAGFASLILIPFHFAFCSRRMFHYGKFSPPVMLRYAMTLLVSLALNVGLVCVYWAYFLAAPLPALILAFIPAMIVNFALLKYLVCRERPARGLPRPAGFFVAATTIAIASLALYAALAAILLYTRPLLHADDWRIYADYFFNRDLWDSVISRQNGHLIILPSATMLINHTFFSGDMSNLSILNAGLFGVTGAFGAYVANRVLTEWGMPAPARLAVGSTLLAFGLILLAPTMQFWGLGIHNAFVVVGVAGAALMASGFAGPLSKFPAAGSYVLFALLASTSFSTGSAAWALGFAGALLMRERPIVILLYFVGGAVMGALTIGPQAFTSDTGHAATFDLLSIAQFIPAFLGNVPLLDFITPRDHIPRFFSATIVGLFGLTLYAALSCRILKRWHSSEQAVAGFGYTYFWMVASFAILSGALVGTGRVGSSLGIYASLFPRFQTWSMLFWVALVGAVIMAAFDWSRRAQGRSPVALVATLAAALLVMFTNLSMMSTRVAYAHNSAADAATQVAVNREDEDVRARLWRPDTGPTVRKVIAHLRLNRRNLFLFDWAHLMGSEAVKTALAEQSAGPCATHFRFKPTPKPNEWHVRGYAVPAESGLSSLEFVVFLDQTGTVAGFALPAFGQPARNIHTSSLLQKIFQQLPVVSGSPGVSGAFIGTVRHNADTGDEPQDLIIAGRDRGGRWCAGRGR